MTRVALALLVALAVVAGCSDDPEGIPRAQARERADATAETYSASVRAHGVQLKFRRLESATGPDGELWVATYVLLPPNTSDEAVVCVYIADKDDWAHRTFDGRCVRDDGTVTVS
jgi:hypothetical protein